MPNKIKYNMSNIVNITIVTHEIHEFYITKLLDETLNCALLESGWTKYICGESQFNNYINTLKKRDLAKVTERESLTSFKLGHNAVESKKIVTFPAMIGTMSKLIFQMKR